MRIRQYQHLRAVAVLVGTLALAAFPARGAYADVPTCTAELETTACLASTAEELEYGIANTNVSSITLGTNITTAAEVAVTRDLSIDLGGYTLTGGVQKDTIKVYTGATLTIANGGVVGYKSSSSAIYNNGTVNATSVNFTVDESATPFYVVTNHGVMTLNDCTARRTTAGGASVVENGYANYNSGNERTGYVNGVNTQYPRMTINGGDYTLVSGGGVEVIKTDDGADTVINAGRFLSDENTTGYLLQLSGRSLTINGGTFTSNGEDVNAIVYACDGGSVNTCVFNIHGGVFNAPGYTIYNRSNYSYSNFGAATINVTGGIFKSSQVADLVASGYGAYDGEDGYYVIADSDFTIAFGQDAYEVTEGESVEVSAVVEPSTIGLAERSDVTYAVYYMDRSELTNEEASVNGSVITARIGAAGTYKIVATDMKGQEAEATLAVEPRGSVTMTSKTVYVPMYQMLTWEELGVIATGEGYSVEVAGGDETTSESSSQMPVASVDMYGKTVSLYGEEAELSWYYDEELVGTIVLRGYNDIWSYSKTYIRNGWFEEYSEGYAINEGLTYTIQDESIAKFEGPFEVASSDGHTYNAYRIRGVKVGETGLSIAAKDGSEVIARDNAIVVFDMESDIKLAQAIGTSQTFSFEPQAGYKLEEVYAGSYSEDGEEPAVEFSDNEDGTYTLTVHKLPCYRWSSMDEGGQEVEEEYCSRVVPVEVQLTVGDEQEGGLWVSVYYGVSLYEVEVKDKAAEEVDGAEVIAESNEEILGDYAAEILEAVFTDADIMSAEGPVTITLSDGETVAEIEDVQGLIMAVQSGDPVVMTLVAPDDITDTVDEKDVADLREGLSKVEGEAEGVKFLNIDVLLTAGGDSYGKVTELKQPLRVAIDVSGDKEVPAGHTRQYIVLRKHGSDVASLKADYDDENKVVTTESDRFSTYLIAYVDTPNESKPEDKKEESGKTEETKEDTQKTDDKKQDDTKKADAEDDTKEDAANSKKSTAGVADTGTFTSEGGSAEAGASLSAILGVMSVIAVLVMAGAMRYAKKS